MTGTIDWGAVNDLMRKQGHLAGVLPVPISPSTIADYYRRIPVPVDLDSIECLDVLMERSRLGRRTREAIIDLEQRGPTCSGGSRHDRHRHDIDVLAYDFWIEDQASFRPTATRSLHIALAEFIAPPSEFFFRRHSQSWRLP